MSNFSKLNNLDVHIDAVISLLKVTKHDKPDETYDIPCLKDFRPDNIEYVGNQYKLKYTGACYKFATAMELIKLSESFDVKYLIKKFGDNFKKWMEKKDERNQPSKSDQVQSDEKPEKVSRAKRKTKRSKGRSLQPKN